MDGELPRREDLGLVFDELDHQMACQVYLWALPLVSYAQWKTQHHEVFGATSSDLVHYVSYRDRLGLITANATTPYILNFFDLGETGPLVGRAAAGPDRRRDLGLLAARVRGPGRDGPGPGEGGKHLIVPPGQDAPDGGRRLLRPARERHEHHVRLPHPRPRPGRARRRWSTRCGSIRTPTARRPADPDRLARTARPWTGDQPRGLDYWVRLHDIYQREIVDERDRFYLAMLKQLGIEKGKPFEPDERLTEILTTATAAGELMAQANTFAKRFEGAPYWPDRQWDLRSSLDNSAQRGENYDELLGASVLVLRGRQLLGGDEEPDPGLGQAYLGSYTDADGDWLDGGAALHAARPGGSAREAVLVGDGLRRADPLPDRQRAAARRPRLPRHRPRPQRRRLGRPLLRPDTHRPARSPTGCRPSPAGTGSPTSASTARSSRTSTAAGSSATSLRRQAETRISMEPTQNSALVTQAYLYGFPLVFNLDQVTRYVTEGVGANPAAPFNTFSHARKLAGPQDTFVTINNDTLYSMAQLDLSVGPVALHVPDTAGRYYVLQFVDAWTNNFAYVGHRATGTGEGDFLLVPPGWDGAAPDGHIVDPLPHDRRVHRRPLVGGRGRRPAGRARVAGRDHAHARSMRTRRPSGSRCPTRPCRRS